MGKDVRKFEAKKQKSTYQRISNLPFTAGIERFTKDIVPRGFLFEEKPVPGNNGVSRATILHGILIPNSSIYRTNLKTAKDVQAYNRKTECIARHVGSPPF